MSETLRIGGIDMTLRRTSSRSIRIRLSPVDRQVRISAGQRISRAAIVSFANDQLGWIRDQLETLPPDPHPLDDSADLAGPKAYALARIQFWTRRLGVEASRVTFRAMTTRWGSCNSTTRRITLNSHLLRRDEPTIDYVVLHEVAHLRVPNHGPDFRAILDAHMPDWKARKNLLNRA